MVIHLNQTLWYTYTCTLYIRYTEYLCISVFGHTHSNYCYSVLLAYLIIIMYLLPSLQSEVPALLDPDPDTCWESDGDQGSHWLRFHMKPGTVVQKLCLLVDPDDSSYLPKRVQIRAGHSGSSNIVQTRSFSSGDYETHELSLFPYPCSQHYPVIEVHFKSCYQGGIDTRIHGVKVICQATDTVFPDSEVISKDLFATSSITRWPKLQAFNPQQLFYRALVLKRIAALIDRDLPYLLPQWKYSSGALEAISTVRQLWPLCKARNVLIEQMLHETVSSVPSSRPVLFINRIAAKQQNENSDKTVFNQVYSELKKHTNPTKFNYRWAGHWTQWWECKFIREGAIDQGGGFRDSLAEIAEELCPSSSSAPVPLPFFIRSPNQSQDSSNAYRDAYTLNTSCQQFPKYQFIGQLMGAVFRSPESLVLSLPQFIWKQLVGEPVTWARDFVTVDSAEVKFIDSIETMEKEKFDATFSGCLNFVTVLSNGTTVSLLSGGEEREVTYDDRLEYCQLVKERRMKETEQQIKALKDGLCMVVPNKVLSLLTWQELEEKVCGSPDIPLSALKQSARYDSGLSENASRVRYMWEALQSFTNEERSRFIRFITGRRRLPVTIYIDSSDSGPSSLPTSATCSNALYLPGYTSVEQASEKLRYAAYNCVAIDTDLSPWE